MDGNTYVTRTCPAPSGSVLTFAFRETPDFSSPGALDPSHKGPCAVYMKRLVTPMARADGDSWFKIWDEGYDTADNMWCTKKLMGNNGLLSVKLPSSLAGGYILFVQNFSLYSKQTRLRQTPSSMLAAPKSF